ncbi:thioredoxin-like domain-containing protein [Aeoliella mucimassa]|uniref:Thiol-disulfide oxidoreductase ResA n=1 Tax=Aeoliella mucimassa TaxID=2527972 RepID=A0A518ANB1_9BACT|nr:thioredoxin-like domain-containing protein [Aeoliella mucimassa]QDU56191.1 Thiol-disulfide oxidoreductase ResA [Aeoliella mucimassa]
MLHHRPCPFPTLLTTISAAVAFVCCPSVRAAVPTVQQALSLKPIQSNVDYDKPSAADAGNCTIQPGKQDGKTAWIVLDPSGAMLRYFKDSNGDNVVDLWCYYKNGLEVYRDIDADFDGKADQYRWFHTGGTRWGLDKDENGKIDSWKQISPYEVAEVAIEAIQKNDANLFNTLLLGSGDVKSLGLGSELEQQVTTSIREAESKFTQFAKSQSVINKQTRFLDFGAARPALVPAGTNGSTKDIEVYENAAALVENGGNPEQVYLGAVVKVDNTWRLLGLPQTGDASAVASLFNIPSADPLGSVAATNAPTEEMQTLMTELEKLDSNFSSDPKQQNADMKRRIEIMQELAKMSPAGNDREQWQRQLADMLSASVQTLQYDEAIDDLKKLAEQLKKDNASKELQAHVEFRRLWSDYIKAGSDPKADYTKVRDSWVESLKTFVNDYPNYTDTAEALLQLGMEQEFAGEEKDAIEWYGKLAKDFPKTDAGQKAQGAIQRIDSIGKVLPLSGNAIGGGKVDLTSYRRKYVLIHYWATWCEPCKEDIEQLKKLHAAYARQGFDIIGVNLDSNVKLAEQYLASNRTPWKHVYDEGGLDGRLANEMGVMTLPLMIFVDDEGKVANRNMHISQLEDELKRVIGKTPQMSRR